jgi:hypothetical protein
MLLKIDSHTRLQDVVQEASPREIRRIWQVRELLCNWGVATPDYLVAMAAVRQAYIRQVGLKRYVADILGRYAGEAAINFIMYDINRQVIAYQDPEHRTILECLIGSFTSKTLPYSMEYRRNDPPITLVL